MLIFCFVNLKKAKQTKPNQNPAWSIFKFYLIDEDVNDKDFTVDCFFGKCKASWNMIPHIRHQEKSKQKVEITRSWFYGTESDCKSPLLALNESNSFQGGVFFLPEVS